MKYFKLDEFKCPCCGEVHMNEMFLDRLDAARKLAGVPFVITSGYRCPKHNKEVGGVPDSAHVKGFAADIKCTNSRNRFLIIDALIKTRFNRLGIGKDFIHVDCDIDKDSNVIWTYY